MERRKLHIGKFKWDKHTTQALLDEKVLFQDELRNVSACPQDVSENDRYKKLVDLLLTRNDLEEVLNGDLHLNHIDLTRILSRRPLPLIRGRFEQAVNARPANPTPTSPHAPA